MPIRFSKSGNFTVNDHARLHPAGNYVWGTATVKEDLLVKDGKPFVATLRWTVVLRKIEGQMAHCSRAHFRARGMS